MAGFKVTEFCKRLRKRPRRIRKEQKKKSAVWWATFVGVLLTAQALKCLDAKK